MRRKNLISPEKLTEDIIKHQFKLLFFPDLSYAIAVTILGAFCFAIFALTQTKYPIVAITISIAFLLFGLFLQTLVVFFLVKISDIILMSEEISGQDLLYRRNSIKWKEITFVKQYNLLGLRYLSVKTENNNIQIPVRLYEVSVLIDRVRELAGEDHILVRALEKELSRPRKELTKLWVGVIGSIALTISIYLIGGNMYAAEQEKPLEQSIASYVRQHPKTAPNQSAIDLQALIAKLGLSIGAFGDGTEVKVKPDKATISEWKAIEPTFKKYLDKQLETKELIEPFSVELVNYLKKHNADIEAIETHLIDNPIPQWGSDIGWIEKSDLKAGDSPYSIGLNGLNIWYVENLIIFNVLDKQLLPNIDIFRDLAAIEKMQQSFQIQQSLIPQLVARIGERRISDLVRRVDRIPTEWGNNLFSIDRHSSMYSAIVEYSIDINRRLQNEAMFSEMLMDRESPLRFIPGYFKLARPQIRLEVVARHREILQGLDYWSEQNICRTNGQVGVSPTSISGVDTYDASTPNLASKYHTVLRSDLRWEATKAIRQVKAKLAAGEKVDRVAEDFNIPSQVCPGEQWTAKATDGSVNISFSHPPDWKALGVNNIVDIEPLTYKIKPSIAIKFRQSEFSSR
jgi:hypothetical protein